MGLFDTVWVKCPKCGKENDFQSKSGDCLLDNYDLDNCPDNVLEDINRHSPVECEVCSILYLVDIKQKKAVIFTGGMHPELINQK